MAYQLLKIQQISERFAALVDKAKKAGEYEGNETDWDSQIAIALEKAAAFAADWTAENARMGDQTRRECQAKMRDIESMLKSKKFSGREMNAIEDMSGEIFAGLNAVKRDNSDLNSALVPQYRKDGWITIARSAMFDTGPVDDLQDARGRQIKVGAMTIQITRRLEEYAKRAEDYIKMGRKRLNMEDSLTEALADIDGIVGRMERGRTDVSTYIYSCSNALDMLEGERNTRAAPDPKVMKMYLSYGSKFKGAAKQARGKLKTMGIGISTLKKRVKSVTGLDAKPQTKAALEHYSAAADEYSEFEGRVKAAEKILTKLEKL